jgi:hypothetical protein
VATFGADAQASCWLSLRGMFLIAGVRQRHVAVCSFSGEVPLSLVPHDVLACSQEVDWRPSGSRDRGIANQLAVPVISVEDQQESVRSSDRKGSEANR